MWNREAEKNKETYAEIDEESERNMKFSLIEGGKNAHKTKSPTHLPYISQKTR